jgi:hypothetical protein
MDFEKRMETFKDELSLILKPEIKDFTIECIRISPDYVFEDCPSSSSGKFHPVDECSATGTILHSKRVFALAYELSRALNCEEYRDEICAAAILHDMAKQGLTKSGHTTRDHPQTMAKLIADVYNNSFKEKISKESAFRIYFSVFHHYGNWSEASIRKPLNEYKPWELCVYLADYVSSKRFVHVDHLKGFTGVV